MFVFHAGIIVRGTATPSLRGRFCSRQVGLQELDLPVVIGFVLGDVKPLAIFVGWAPAPSLVDRHQPGIVAFPKFCKRLLARFTQNV